MMSGPGGLELDAHVGRLGRVLGDRGSQSKGVGSSPSETMQT